MFSERWKNTRPPAWTCGFSAYAVSIASRPSRDSSDHEYLERRPRLQRVHETENARTIRKLGPGNPIVYIDVIFRDEPAFARGVLAPVLDLPRDGFLIVGYAVLLVLLRA